MKKITHILLLLFLLNSFSSKAQYIPLVKDSVHWFVANCNQCSGPGTYGSIFEYYSLGDTTVNSMVYKKVFKRDIQSVNNNYIPPYQPTNSYNLIALLREDTANRSVYTIMLQPSGPCYSAPNQEELLYDFNLNLGDSLNSNMCIFSTYTEPIIGGISNTTIYGYATIEYLRVGLSITSYYEGIGSQDGLFEPQSQSTTTSLRGYCIGSNINCNLTTGVKKLANNISFNIYPNPSNGFFTVKIKNVKNATIEIYNISGQFILQKTLAQSTSKIDLANYPKGIYFARITNQHQTVTKKIVIQ